MTAIQSTPFTSDLFGTWLSDVHWAPSHLTFSFPLDGTTYDYGQPADVSALGQTQKQAVRRALDEISGFTGLTLTEITESPATEATLRFAREAGLTGAYAYEPAGLSWGGDSFYGAGTYGPVIGNEANLFFLHEIGHTLGLLHGHESAKFAASGFDGQDYTLMTYSDYDGDPDPYSYDSGEIDWAQSYMQLDIAALQFLYGANYAATGEAWSGDTVYSFDPQTGEMCVNGAGLGAPAGNRIFRTIWDGHGTDTYDLRNYGTDLRIDLAPGAWSVFSVAQLADLNRYSPDPRFLAEGNVANARLVGGDTRALIENARGGSGDDVIRGNQGANLLTGGPGDDRLVGRDGADLLRGNRGADILEGGARADRLFGGAQDDILRGGRGDDTLSGGEGRDRLFGADGVDRLKGERHADQLDGGAAGDRLDGGNGDDLLRGQSGADDLRGGFGRDRLEGGAGADTLRGGAGADVLIGGSGTDRLFGLGGADVFRFTRASDSPVAASPDVIEDFAPGEDRIDLAGLDAMPLDLAIRGGFTGSGASAITREGSGSTRVLVDADGDGGADFRVLVAGVAGLVAGDFLL